MIQLECSNCKTLLTIDDAFAGGVCRCQHCGTIQTVPKPGKDASADANSPKALFKRKARIESALSPYNDGLDRAADEMESSGSLSAHALANVAGATRSKNSTSDDSTVGTPRPTPRAAALSGSSAGVPSPVQPDRSRPSPQGPAKPGYVPTPSKSANVHSTPLAPVSPVRPPLLVALIIASLVALGTIIYLSLRTPKAPASEPPVPKKVDFVMPPPATRDVAAPPSAAPQTPTPTPLPVSPDLPKSPDSPATTPTSLVAPPVPQVPTPSEPANIAGIPLAGDAIIFVLNRAGCDPEGFSQMSDLCLKAAEGLGPGKRFQVVVWNSSRETAYPPAEFADVVIPELAAARRTLAESFAGSSDISTTFSKATTLHPAAIVLISATDLNEAQAAQLHTALIARPVPLHTIAYGPAAAGEQLQKLASDHAGQYKHVPAQN